MFNLKKVNDFRFIAYVPMGFETLFFAADEIRIIPKKFLEFDRYSEVSDFFPRKNAYLQKILHTKERIIKSFALNCQNQLLFLLLNLMPTPRQARFLSRSTLRWIRRDFKKNNQPSKILRRSICSCKRNYFFVVRDFVQVSQDLKFYVQNFDLSESLKYLFEQHANALENGVIQKFIDFQSERRKTDHVFTKSIFLRTRNYRKKAVVHNSTVENIYPLVKSFLGAGIQVVNIGSPCLELQDYFSREINYFEFNNKLNIDEEFSMLNSVIIQRADAGLFVLATCTPYAIICLTEEFSKMWNISLIQSRSKYRNYGDLAFSEDLDDFKIIKHIELMGL